MAVEKNINLKGMFFMSKYNKTVVLVLCVLFGWLGVHRLYVGKIKSGILYLLTFGLCGLGWLIDILLILTDKFKDGNGNLLTLSQKTESVPAQSQPIPTNSQANPNTPKNSDYSDDKETDDRPEIKIPSEIDGLPLTYKYFDVNICVISGQEPDYNAIIERLLVEPMVTTLEIEADNQYDNKAVRVMFNGSKLGYLYRGKIKDMAYDYIKKECPIFSCLSSIDPESYKMKMFIGFYCKKIYKNSVSFKLTSNSNAEMQETLEFSSEGDELDFYYDYEKEKYCFSDIGEIGYAPSSKTELLDEIEDDCIATIKEISENENGKLSVTVNIEY